jgi:hypothetical protein
MPGAHGPVLSSTAALLTCASLVQAVVFCQIERAKETLLNKLYSGIR